MSRLFKTTFKIMATSSLLHLCVNDENDNGVARVEVIQTEHLADLVVSLKQQVDNLETDFKDSVDSAVNREMLFREYVYRSLNELESKLMDSIGKLEREVFNCLQRRDEQWRKQRDKLTSASSPISYRTIATSTDIAPLTHPNPCSLSGASPCCSVTSSASLTTCDPTCLENHRPAEESATATKQCTIFQRNEVQGSSKAGCAVPHKGYFDLPITWAELAQAQAADPEVCGLKQSSMQPSEPPSWTSFVICRGVLCRWVLTQDRGGKHQVVVPRTLIPQFLQHYHLGSSGRHLGQLKTLLRLLKVAWWPTVRQDIWEHARSCPNCIQSRAANPKPSSPCLGMVQRLPEEKQEVAMRQDPRRRPGARAMVRKDRRRWEKPNRPSPHPQHAESQKRTEKVKRRARVHQARHAKLCIPLTEAAPFQQGNLVCARTHPSSKATHNTFIELAPKWEGPANINNKSGPVNRIGWDNPHYGNFNINDFVWFYGVLPW